MRIGQIAVTQNWVARKPAEAATTPSAADPQESSQADGVSLPLSKLERSGIGAAIGAAAAGGALALFGAVGIGLGAAAVAVGAVAGAYLGGASWQPYRPELPFKSAEEIRSMPEYNWTVPTRAQQLERLKDPNQRFDLIIVGGGATGAGAALEASRRGLKVALLEGSDFAAGTSSRSTKLIHGGVRYLEKAVKNLDGEQYSLVKEGLHERHAFLDMAPHLTDEVRLITPIYKTLEVPYYYAGLWLYDMIAGREALEATRLLSPSEVRQRLPEAKTDGLKGGVAYSDGEFNDSRLNVGLATTAAAHSAVVTNHTRVIDLVKDATGQIVGVRAQDQRSGEAPFTIQGKVVINATGPHIDAIRQMDDPSTPELVVPSAGTHIFVEKLKLNDGLLVPKAPNGSVAFFKPFEGGTLIGTTEEPTAITMEPGTTQEQVSYLVGVANDYLNQDNQIGPADVTSVWTGIRPLVQDPEKVGGDNDTVSISRNHIIDVSDSGLVTIGGGKWTSFGRMAEEVVDRAVIEAGLQAQPSRRDSARLIGAHGYSGGLATELQSQFGLESQVAEHLASNYGDRSVKLAELAQHGLGSRLHADYPYIEAEVVYAAEHEMAATPVDVLSRRTRMSFIDEEATLSALPRVTQLMAGTLGWDDVTQARELDEARAYYQRNGLSGLRP